MKVKVSIFALLLLISGQTIAQDKQELDKLDEKLRKHLERVMPGWKYERVDPMVPTENVLIQFWSAAERKVKISMIPYRSADEARTALANFTKYERNKEVLTDYGDEGYARGYGSADIAFRKGKLGIFVSTTAGIGGRPEERTLNQDQRFDWMKSEMRKWSRVFAKQAANAIDSP